MDSYEKNYFDFGNGSDTYRLRDRVLGGSAEGRGQPDGQPERAASRQQQAVRYERRQGQGRGVPRRRERAVYDDGHLYLFPPKVRQAKAGAGDHHRGRGGSQKNS